MSGREGYVPGMTGRGEALRPAKNDTTTLQKQEDSPMPGKLTCHFYFDRDPTLIMIDIKEENLDPSSAEYEIYPPVGPVKFEEPEYLFKCTPTDESMEYWVMIKEDGDVLYLKEERRDGRPYIDRRLLKMLKEEQIRNKEKYVSPYTPTGVNPEWLMGQSPWIRALYGKGEPQYISPYTPTGANPEWRKMIEAEGMNTSR
ncbi:hypothetical protein Q9189_001981 [Teloschistes chrysophthalmus]